LAGTGKTTSEFGSLARAQNLRFALAQGWPCRAAAHENAFPLRRPSFLNLDIPDTMKAFSTLAQAATRDGALVNKTHGTDRARIGIATRCDLCIGFHTEAPVRLGATRRQVAEVPGMAVHMGGGPSLIYAADAIAAYEEFAKQMNVAA
jgi:AhpD family alkylhydroperoxidase